MTTFKERFLQFFNAPRPGELDYYEEEATGSPAEEPGNASNPAYSSYTTPAVPGTAVPGPSVPPTPNRPPALAASPPLPVEVPLRTGTYAADTSPSALPVRFTPDPVRDEVPPAAALTIPYWLEDEDTLRDEGVLFGLSESEPTEKTEIIKSYFAHLAADPEREVEQQNERVQELNLFIGQKENRIEELQHKLKNAEDLRHAGEHQLPRTLVGLTLSVAMCVGNYYLIEETLRPSFAASPLVALGVFLAGMFSLFGRISLFHDTDSNVNGRRLLEEIGMPFAAALFVVAQAWQQQAWWQAASLFFFVFFLFLFAGKLLLSNITVLRNDLRVWLSTRREERNTRENAGTWEEEVLRLREEIDGLRVQKWQVLRQQGEAETEREQLYARRDMLIKLFESEFYLARQMKGRLSERQLREIRGQ
ncbi:hypothetical protein HNQ92_003574 [Rhabdobacter roseus]|uniref:Uncharacterized protein n=1 Tax=Rhabdobacter roseus TaxID=1655419 RepID=A0A840TUT7_9BACT|nr:hypothetical protein [Rhabdobacter roseus]MBB5285417.1 hypothetical protein [Rhabdobacter roseus]